MSHWQLVKGLTCLGVTTLLLAGCGGAQGSGSKKVLLIIQEHFNASEYSEPRAMLEEVGAIVAVASSTLDVVTAYAGEAKAQPDVLLGNVHAADYAAIIFVGGYPYNPDDPKMHRIAQEAVAEDKLVAGICNGVITLAKAGVLEGKRVTALIYHPALELEEGGAILVNDAVARDGLIITGNGPLASRQFAEAIVTALEE
jgi:protease I